MKRRSIAKRESKRGQVACELLEERCLMFANNNALSQVFASVRAPVHEDITIQGLSASTGSFVTGENYARSFLTSATIQAIVQADVNQDLSLSSQDDHALHFDDSYFYESAQTINADYVTAVNDANPNSFQPAGVAQAFGQILHAAQDFYAHSNWVNMGLTSLVENGLGFWGTQNQLVSGSVTPTGFAPYSMRSGAILVEGDPPPEYLLAAQNPKDHSKVYIILGDGKRVPAIFTGTVANLTSSGLPDETPPQFALSHDVLNKDWGLPDAPNTGGIMFTYAPRPLFAQARRLAVLQTAHEFQRLGALIVANWGQHALCMLIHSWVKSDAADTGAADTAFHDNPCVLHYNPAPNGNGFPAYTITDLGTLGSDSSLSSEAYGINDNSVVVGYSDTDNGTHAFKYSSGTMTDLGAGEAYSIASDSKIVGSGPGGAFAAYGAISSTDYLFSDANASSSYARSVSSGYVTGAFITSSGSAHAFEYTGSNTDLGTLGGPSSEGYAVNTNGEVVGNADTTMLDDQGYPVYHAFAWINGTMQELSLARAIGSMFSTARGVNSSGMIVGSVHVTDVFHHTTPEIAAYWSSPTSTPILIGKVHEDVGSFATAINDEGWAIGNSYSPANVYDHPFLWRPGAKAVQISKLLVGGDGWTLDQVNGINNLGQIVGMAVPPGGGAVEHAIILNPVVK